MDIQYMCVYMYRYVLHALCTVCPEVPYMYMSMDSLPRVVIYHHGEQNRTDLWSLQ